MGEFCRTDRFEPPIAVPGGKNFSSENQIFLAFTEGAAVKGHTAGKNKFPKA
jgi:hypothetical protein